MFGLSSEEKICSEFYKTLDDIGAQLDQCPLNNQQKGCLLFWLGIVPKAFFQAIFIEEKRIGLNIILKRATQNSGRQCAHLTQAYVVYVLQQFLQNDQNFQESMGFAIEFVENTINAILGSGNLIIQYLTFFRTEFEEKVHPLDQPIFYVAQIAQLLIKDERIFRDTLSEWDNNLPVKMAFINYDQGFLGDMKTAAIKHFAKE